MTVPWCEYDHTSTEDDMELEDWRFDLQGQLTVKAAKEAVIPFATPPSRDELQDARTIAEEFGLVVLDVRAEGPLGDPPGYRMVLEVT